MEPLMTVKDVAKYLGYSTSYIYKLVRLRKIPHRPLGRGIRFQKSKIQEWEQGRNSFAYVERILSFLDGFTTYTYVDRFGTKRCFWNNETFFHLLHCYEKKDAEGNLEGLFRRARQIFGRYHDENNETPEIKHKIEIDERTQLIIFASGHIYLSDIEHYDDNPQQWLDNMLETYQEDAKEIINEWIVFLKDEFPEMLDFWCNGFCLCVSSELLGHIRQDEEEFTYIIPVRTSDNKNFMRQVFNKMNLLIGRQPSNKWRNAVVREFRDNTVIPYIQKRYEEYKKRGFSSDESREKTVRDVKKEFPEWKNFLTINERAIMRYIRKN